MGVIIPHVGVKRLKWNNKQESGRQRLARVSASEMLLWTERERGQSQRAALGAPPVPLPSWAACPSVYEMGTEVARASHWVVGFKCGCQATDTFTPKRLCICCPGGSVCNTMRTRIPQHGLCALPSTTVPHLSQGSPRSSEMQVTLHLARQLGHGEGAKGPAYLRPPGSWSGTEAELKPGTLASVQVTTWSSGKGDVSASWTVGNDVGGWEEWSQAHAASFWVVACVLFPGIYLPSLKINWPFTPTHLYLGTTVSIEKEDKWIS